MQNPPKTIEELENEMYQACWVKFQICHRMSLADLAKTAAANMRQLRAANQETATGPKTSKTNKINRRIEP